MCNKAEAVLSGVLSVRVVSGFVMICLVLSCVIARVVSGFSIVRAEFSFFSKAYVMLTELGCTYKRFEDISPRHK